MKNLIFVFLLSASTFFNTASFAKGEEPVSRTLTVKVVDSNGKLVMSKTVSINEFLEKGHNIAGLPENSLFVLFHGNTAYYITEEENTKK